MIPGRPSKYDLPFFNMHIVNREKERETLYLELNFEKKWRETLALELHFKENSVREGAANVDFLLLLNS